MRRRFSLLPLGLLVGLTAALVATGFAGGSALANGGTIINHNQKCLDMPNSTEVVIFSCDGSASETWVIVGINGDFLIESGSRPGLCLSATNPIAGAPVVPRSCDTADPLERWFRTDPTPDGIFFELANRGVAGLVMAPAGCGSANGTRVVMASDNACLADLWRF